MVNVSFFPTIAHEQDIGGGLVTHTNKDRENISHLFHFLYYKSQLNEFTTGVTMINLKGWV